MQTQTTCSYAVQRLIIFAAILSTVVHAEQVTIEDRQFTIPDGFHLESAVAQGLTQRPIVVDFDEQGNLYVAESSGTNDNVQKQLEERPHTILRLTDSNNDGKFDQRTVFADRMMFPEGTLWHDGSLYVAAPPQIWKLTDTDDDGVADRREVWFDAKTLTGCANDLHGPYFGPDGWIYWCKGAFAEQTYERPGRQPFVTRAAHIFRRRPEGGPIEPVMTGGMDNPVEVAFSETGERFFTTTFFQHPANGRRDGLVHAIYGGVYGKQHGVIDGHPRTGDLMPVMTHLGAAAPSGLLRLESDTLGFRNQLISACFNLHSVQRHELVAHGSTYTTVDTELISSEDLDFHPTDIAEDADGSLLIVDTGGWYQLCCPTSQLHKPDVLGGIYRLRKRQATAIDDPRGNRIDWQSATSAELADLLSDSRYSVRRRAISRLSQLGDAATRLSALLRDSSTEQARLNAVWTACRIDSQSARAVVRMALADEAPRIRQAAAHAVSAWRDGNARAEIQCLLEDNQMSVRRAAAEALGRVGDASSVRYLFSALKDETGRVLEHALIYALIEINAADATRTALASSSVKTRRAALRALHEMQNGGLTREEICRFLASDDADIRQIVTGVAAERPEWGSSYATVLRARSRQSDVAQQVSRLTNSKPVRQLALEWLQSATIPTRLKTQLVDQLRTADFETASWDAALNNLLASEDHELIATTVRQLASNADSKPTGYEHLLRSIAMSAKVEGATRLLALRCIDTADDTLFNYAVSQLVQDSSVHDRSLAATALCSLKLTPSQVSSLADVQRTVGPLELGRVLTAFESQSEPTLGVRLFTSLVENPAAGSLPPDRIANLAKQFGSEVVQLARPLLEQSDVTPEEKAFRIDGLLSQLPNGDVRRGQVIFHSEKTACFACHAIGYRGGTIGPDLSRIARIRSRRDLLESILYPSASFVRSYEPVSILTTEGQQITGSIRNQSDSEITLQLNATEQQTISTRDIETMLPSLVSIMPAGLEKQLSRQELADLLAFLESRN